MAGGWTNKNEMMESRSLKKRESLELKRTGLPPRDRIGSRGNQLSKQATRKDGRLLGLQRWQPCSIY